jgi:hypothetical protein
LTVAFSNSITVFPTDFFQVGYPWDTKGKSASRLGIDLEQSEVIRAVLKCQFWEVFRIEEMGETALNHQFPKCLQQVKGDDSPILGFHSSAKFPRAAGMGRWGDRRMMAEVHNVVKRPGSS